jgi:hypothetical protein
VADDPRQGSFFGPLPTRGIWTAFDLTRDQFLLILALSVGLFVFIDGPIWSHARDSHFWRITWSYLAIPVAVALSLVRNGKLAAAPFIVGSAVISLIKLVLTARLLVAIGVALG